MFCLVGFSFVLIACTIYSFTWLLIILLHNIFSFQKFLDSSKLRRHFLIHTGERDFVCPHEGCGKVIILHTSACSLFEIYRCYKSFYFFFFFSQCILISVEDKPNPPPKWIYNLISVILMSYDWVFEHPTYFLHIMGNFALMFDDSLTGIIFSSFNQHSQNMWCMMLGFASS